MAIFGADLLYDPRTGRGLGGVTVSVRHPTTGAPVAVSTPVVTNAKGYFSRFETVGADASLEHVTLTVEDAVQDAVAVGSLLSVIDPGIESRIAALESDSGTSGTDIKVGGTQPATGWWLDNGGAAPADTTPPNPGTLGVSAETSTGFTLTVTGASDAGGLHAQPYRFSLDNGSTYSEWQSSNVYVATGRTPSTTYQVRAAVRDAAGNEATAAASATTSAASTNITDDFTGADATVVGRTTTTGSKVWEAAADGQTAGAAVSGSLQISGNKLSNVGAIRSALLPVGLTRYSAEAAYTAGAGVTIRLNICTAPTTAPNFNGGGITYQFSTNGAYVVQGTGAPPAVVGVVNGATGVATGTLKIQYDGTTLTGWHNGNLVASAAVALTGTNLAVHISGSAPWGYLDDLVITPLP